jgi:protein ImuA
MSRAADFLALKAAVAALETARGLGRSALPLGDDRLDAVFPAGGLPLGCWHEVAGEGLELETGATATAFVAALARPLADRGAVVWVMRRDDLYAPGLAGLGFPAERLIQVAARDEDQALAALEDALGAAGVAAAIGEVAEADLTAGRRLQLACERRGATGFLIARRPFGGRGPVNAGSAAATRWTVAPAPSGPPEGRLEGWGPEALGWGAVGMDGRGLDALGLGRPRWRASLTRCRGGRPGSWIVEMTDGPYPLRLVTLLGDRQLAATPPHAFENRSPGENRNLGGSRSPGEWRHAG